MRTLIAWLNKRFPQQLVVTLQDWNDLRQEVASYNRHGQALVELNNRLIKIEKNLDNLNTSSGFTKGGFKLER